MFLGIIIETISNFSVPTFDKYVYVTPYGEKYHYHGCCYLSNAEYCTNYDNYLEAESSGYAYCSKCGNENHSLTTKVDIWIDKKQ